MKEYEEHIHSLVDAQKAKLEALDNKQNRDISRLTYKYNALAYTVREWLRFRPGGGDASERRSAYLKEEMALRNLLQMY